MRPRESPVPLDRAIKTYVEGRGCAAGAVYRWSWNRVDFLFGSGPDYWKVEARVEGAKSRYASLVELDDALYDAAAAAFETKWLSTRS